MAETPNFEKEIKQEAKALKDILKQKGLDRPMDEDDVRHLEKVNDNLRRTLIASCDTLLNKIVNYSKSKNGILDEKLSRLFDDIHYIKDNLTIFDDPISSKEQKEQKDMCANLTWFMKNLSPYLIDYSYKFFNFLPDQDEFKKNGYAFPNPDYLPEGWMSLTGGGDQDFKLEMQKIGDKDVVVISPSWSNQKLLFSPGTDPKKVIKAISDSWDHPNSN